VGIHVQKVSYWIGGFKNVLKSEYNDDTSGLLLNHEVRDESNVQSERVLDK